jgi:ABC-type sulfate transport system substrate-binding protein
MWNNNPYYILDTDWSSGEQREAANTFFEFLMSESVQKKALLHGFRPGNPSVPIKFADSPFTRYAKYGVTIDVNIASEPPEGAVLKNLQQTAQLIYGSQ